MAEADPDDLELEGGDGDGEGEGDSPVWREDWRNQITEDEKELAQLGRYATPADLWTKARALEQRISSGELRNATPYPDKGSEADQVQWRKDNGIPESFDKYDIGRTFDPEDEAAQADKASMDAFLEYAHGKNMPQDAVKVMSDWFYEKLDQDLEAIDARDKEARSNAEEALRAEWGSEYRGHLNRINNLMETAPAGVKDQLLDAQLPGGGSMRDNPEAMKFLLGLALEQVPFTTVVPAGGDQMSSIQDEIDEIKGKMNTKEYKQTNSKMRARYYELLKAQKDMGGKK